MLVRNRKVVLVGLLIVDTFLKFKQTLRAPARAARKVCAQPSLKPTNATASTRMIRPICRAIELLALSAPFARKHLISSRMVVRHRANVR